MFAFPRAARAQVFTFSADLRAKNTMLFILITEHQLATLLWSSQHRGVPAHLLECEQFVAFEGQEWFCAKDFRSSLKSWCPHHQKFSISAKRSGGSIFCLISANCLSSQRAKRVGPKGLRAESARAVTGRLCPHSGEREDFLMGQLNFFQKTTVTPERKVEKLFPIWEINRHAEG